MIVFSDLDTCSTHMERLGNVGNTFHQIPYLNACSICSQNYVALAKYHHFQIKGFRCYLSSVGRETIQHKNPGKVFATSARESASLLTGKRVSNKFSAHLACELMHYP